MTAVHSSTLIGASELVSGGTDVLARAVRAAAVARRWFTNEALGELVALRGGDLDEILAVPVSEGDENWLHLQEELPEWLRAADDLRSCVPEQLADAAELLHRLLAVERWASVAFNFRGDAVYRERNQAFDGGFDTATGDAILASATELGLRQPTKPHYERYDCCVVLGGGWLSPLLRARYAASWAAEGIDLGELHFLGSPRFLLEEVLDDDGGVRTPPERDKTDRYAPGAVDEFDLLVAAACTEFDLAADDPVLLCGCHSMDATCPRWSFAAAEVARTTPPPYTHERAVQLRDGAGSRRGTVFSPSTGRPPIRPDTTDTLALWTRQVDPQAGWRVLVVTTQVFVPFQAFDSLKRLYLPHSVDVDVVGFSADWGDRPDTPEYLLQETLSAVRSARRLLVEALADTRSG